IENDGDVLWTPDTRERNEDVAARGVKFMKWLLTREEKEIAVVTHSGFLYHTLGAYGDDCHPTLKKEMSKQNSIGMALELLGEVRYGRYTVDRSPERRHGLLSCTFCVFDQALRAKVKKTTQSGNGPSDPRNSGLRASTTTIGYLTLGKSGVLSGNRCRGGATRWRFIV
ncbi:hypothetical protein R6Q59_019892, partial [Mikania micrantha]